MRFENITELSRALASIILEINKNMPFVSIVFEIVAARNYIIKHNRKVVHYGKTSILFG